MIDGQLTVSGGETQNCVNGRWESTGPRRADDFNPPADVGVDPVAVSKPENGKLQPHGEIKAVATNDFAQQEIKGSTGPELNT